MKRFFKYLRIIILTYLIIVITLIIFIFLSIFFFYCKGFFFQSDKINLPNLTYIKNINNEYPELLSLIQKYNQICDVNNCYKDSHYVYKISSFDYDNDNQNEIILMGWSGVSGGYMSAYFIDNQQIIDSYSLKWDDCTHYSIITKREENKWTIHIKGENYNKNYLINKTFIFK